MADRSGGLISFEAGSVHEAEQLVAGLLEDAWLKEWDPIAGRPGERDLRTAVAGRSGG